jgi:hypothetical protein
VTELRDRGWDGDDELADQLDGLGRRRRRLRQRGLIVAYTVGFVVTWFIGFSPDRLAELDTDNTVDAGLVPADEVPAGSEDPADMVPALAGPYRHTS